MQDEEPRHNGRTAYELASDAEKSLRGIVHLSEADERPLTVETIYRTLSGVTRAMEQLPEVVSRLRAAAQTEHETRQLTVSAGPYVGDPDAALSETSDAVDKFLSALGPALTALSRSQAALAEVRTRA